MHDDSMICRVGLVMITAMVVVEFHFWFIGSKLNFDAATVHGETIAICKLWVVEEREQSCLQSQGIIRL